MAESFENLADWENEDLEKSLAEAVDSYDKQEKEKKTRLSVENNLTQLAIFVSVKVAKFEIKRLFSVYFNSLLYKTNRFHVAVRLFSNRSQRTSKCGKNISDTLGCAPCATFLFLPLFCSYHILTSSVIYY